MRSKFRSASLLALFLFASAAFVAACSGGGHGEAPCCSATGSVEQQPALIATPALRARPFIFDETTNNDVCPKLDSPGLDATLMQKLTPAGAAADVDATGHYTVSLSKAAEGKRAVIVIFSADGPKGLVLLNSDVAPTGTSDPIQVGPAGLVGATHVGESILELATFCHLVKNDLMGSLTPADIRAFITRDIAANFTPDAPNALAIANGIKAYGDAIADFETQSPDATTLDAFRTLREKAEGHVDACRNGAEAGAGCDDTVPLDWEFYRYWRLSRDAASLGLTTWGAGSLAAAPRYHFQAWVQSMNNRLGTIPTPETSHPYGLSLLRQTYMLRVELAEASIEAATATAFDTRPGIPISLTLATAGFPSVADSFHALRLAIASDNSAASIEGAWDLNAGNIIGNVERQGGFDPQSASAMTALYNGSDKPYATAAQNSFSSTTPYDQLFVTVYTASAAAGEWGKVRGDLDAAGVVPPEVLALPADQKDRLADILYFTSASAVPLQ